MLNEEDLKKEWEGKSRRQEVRQILPQDLLRTEVK